MTDVKKLTSSRLVLLISMPILMVLLFFVSKHFVIDWYSRTRVLAEVFRVGILLASAVIPYVFCLQLNVHKQVRAVVACAVPIV